MLPLNPFDDRLNAKGQFVEWSNRLSCDLIGSFPGLSFCLMVAYSGIRER